MSSAESHLGLLDSIVRSAERSCEGVFCCLGHRRKVSALCFLYNIYRIGFNPMNEYLNHFVADRNAIASATLGELNLMIKRYRTDQFCRLFLPAALRLGNLLPPGALSGGTLSSFTSAKNLCLLRA